MSLQHRAKRPRHGLELAEPEPAQDNEPRSNTTTPTLSSLLQQQQWQQAIDCVTAHPQEAIDTLDPSPLALACRVGAPWQCVKALLDAAPAKLRRVLDSRGTPLHEAIVCPGTEAKVIEVLLRADEALGTESPRATLLQDVDGFTPLHLLFRRRFQSHLLLPETNTSLIDILNMLVKSCPEAVLVPDMGEYEEPPIVYALKANIYAPSLGSEDETLTRIERLIYEMVSCLLKYCPEAASRVFTGYRGRYTALHSAVFHGRFPSTIELLLQAEAANPSEQKAALLANTQGEMPLHFCAMRGERPRSIALISEAAPEAVLERDASGLTPLHWLWIRFVSTLLAVDVGGRGTDTTMPIDMARQPSFERSPYAEFSSLEKGDFDVDVQLIKRMDPPVDFLRMRHIPLEVLGATDCLEWAERTVSVLQQIRGRYETDRNSQDQEESRMVVWTKRETMISLFWTKVVSLLEAAKSADQSLPSGSSVIVHTAFASPCCPPGVAYTVASLFPEELIIRDASGRFPVHYAASRQWHAWDWPRNDNPSQPFGAKLLQQESFGILRTALELSPAETLRVTDSNDCLVLHQVVNTFVRACTRPARSCTESPMNDMLELLHKLVNMYPEALQRRDGVTRLYPFQQATAVATEHKTQSQHVQDELSLTITYQLLRENPTTLFSNSR
jgi:ankyrin repeat protein